jgi:CubicO group peptidase (beta-lactamase class C family)
MLWDPSTKAYRPIEKALVHGAMEPCGGLFSSITDMAKFMAFQMTAWPPRNVEESPILSRSALRESQLSAGLVVRSRNTRHSPAGSQLGNSDRGDVAPGVNWWASEWRDLGLSDWHNGANEGYQSDLLIFPKRNFGVIVLSGALEKPSAEPSARATRGGLCASFEGPRADSWRRPRPGARSAGCLDRRSLARERRDPFHAVDAQDALAGVRYDQGHDGSWEPLSARPGAAG